MKRLNWVDSLRVLRNIIFWDVHIPIIWSPDAWDKFYGLNVCRKSSDLLRKHITEKLNCDIE
jgi:hypothetical protein